MKNRYTITYLLPTAMSLSAEKNKSATHIDVYKPHRHFEYRLLNCKTKSLSDF